MLCAHSRGCASVATPHASLTPIRTLPLQPAGRRAACLRTQPRRLQRAAVQRHSICSAQAAEVGKEISKVEIPAFIPRSDITDQLIRWAYTAAGTDGLENFGDMHTNLRGRVLIMAKWLPMRVQVSKDSDGDQNGFIVDIVREGVTATSIAVIFDEEITQKHEWVGRASDGFPVLEGKGKDIKGKHLIVRKMDDNKVDEILRASIRGLCESLVSALNKYYAFGSCFSEEL